MVPLEHVAIQVPFHRGLRRCLQTGKAHGLALSRIRRQRFPLAGALFGEEGDAIASPSNPTLIA